MNLEVCRCYSLSTKSWFQDNDSIWSFFVKISSTLDNIQQITLYTLKICSKIACFHGILGICLNVSDKIVGMLFRIEQTYIDKQLLHQLSVLLLLLFLCCLVIFFLQSCIERKSFRWVRCLKRLINFEAKNITFSLAIYAAAIASTHVGHHIYIQTWKAFQLSVCPFQTSLSLASIMIL